MLSMIAGTLGVIYCLLLVGAIVGVFFLPKQPRRGDR